jgi:hypothetical protein
MTTRRDGYWTITTRAAGRTVHTNEQRNIATVQIGGGGRAANHVSVTQTRILDL